jgi:hypothetical protein
VQYGKQKKLKVKPKGERDGYISKEEKDAQTAKEEGLLKCPSIEQQVLVVEKVGNTVKRVRYIQPDLRQLNRHRQLKLRSLEQRKPRQNSQFQCD